ncbi:ribosome maturation factor RimM [Fulvimarina sp. 2208YS6-2-32]|uniref:Ribosome maturation factor RimM n=1 Tax=Fulvimarina uroteuthidis TaxID=3098149 RepID=A0ABU5I0T1_9HYPH|nr:ribosome maturation factor RimM [Fulvimarina sp. 2208YS6-2-32]MDY8108414.1 ribosome maturation factor RimM [Fulvimarina sp. 2208YS6-2-32]
MTLENPVLLGIIGGAHGIRGECRVKSYTDIPTDLGAYGPLQDADGNRYTVKSARKQKNVVVVTFAEVTDRNHAERINGRELFVERALLPEPEDDDEFYLDDLEGLTVETLAGEAVGTVIAVHNFGAGDLLEVAPDEGMTIMIPFSEAAIPELDIETGILRVDPGPAGLLKDGGAQEDEDAGYDEETGDGGEDGDMDRSNG